MAYLHQNYQNLFADALPPLTVKEEKAYMHLAKHSPNPVVKSKARETIVRSNFRFLGRIAIRWAEIHNVDAEDLVAEGKMHLFKAVDKFNESSPVRFLSFAAWDIRHAFQEVLKKSMPVRNMTDADLRRIAYLDTPVALGDDAESSYTLKDALPDIGYISDMLNKENANDARVTVSSMMAEFGDYDKKLLDMYFGLDDSHSGWSVGEIAQHLSANKPSVAHRISNLRRQMQRRYGQGHKDT